MHSCGVEGVYRLEMVKPTHYTNSLKLEIVSSFTEPVRCQFYGLKETCQLVWFENYLVGFCDGS